MSWRLTQYESLPSTSDLCITLAGAGEPAGLAILANRQTAARGSRGRTWQTLPGNLAVSVLLRPGGPPAAAGHWALLAAVALAEALEGAGAPPLRLKWPNDVMLEGRKLGGILLDTGIADRRLDWLVIGFGANLVAAPDLPTATRLPTPIPARDLALKLLERLEHWSKRSEPSPPGRGQGEGASTSANAATFSQSESGHAEQWRASVREAWLARGPAIGTHLRFSTGSIDTAGTFEGLDETGALLLKSGGRVHAFSTGDVLQGA